jgi:hypothetical protein
MPLAFELARCRLPEPLHAGVSLGLPVSPWAGKQATSLSAMEACRSILRLEAAAPADMPEESLRLRQVLRWCLHNEPARAPVQILLRAALDELPPGSRIDPPGLQDDRHLVRLLCALPWVRRGFLRLGRDSDEWATAAEVLCHQAGLELPQAGEDL